MHVGQLLKVERKKKGYSQEYVSVAAGYSRSSIANIESGRYEPSVFSLSVLMDVLSVPDRTLIIEKFVRDQLRLDGAAAC